MMEMETLITLIAGATLMLGWIFRARPERRRYARIR
jgi:hypothetical protein